MNGKTLGTDRDTDSSSCSRARSRGGWAGSSRGVTLIEIMAVVFIIGLAMLASFPFLKRSFQAIQANGSSRELFTDLAMARAEAIKEQLPFLVQFCSDPPGYMIMRCDNGNGEPDSGDFTSAPCNGTIDVCAALAANEAYAGANANAVIRQVNLGGGKSTASGSPLGLARVRFGWTGSVGATPYSCSPAPCGTGPTEARGGLELNDCDAVNDSRFFFHWRGKTGKYSTPASPCQGALYLTGRFTTDEMANRAIEFTTVGSLRTYRWDSQGSPARWE